MDQLTKSILCVKLLEACDCDVNSAIYSLIPDVDVSNKLYTNTLHLLPKNLDSALSLFGVKTPGVNKHSSYFMELKKNEQQIVNNFNLVLDILKYKGPRKIGKNKKEAALSFLSSIYFNTYIEPIQFFLLHSSACSGKWDFWDSVDFITLKQRFEDNDFKILFREKILNSSLWDAKIKLNSFPLLIQRRLMKDKLLDKKLDPGAMIKAMIIQMGSLVRPSINYEVIDLTIREFFTYLNEKKYLRVDREIELLKQLDIQIIKTLKEIL